MCFASAPPLVRSDYVDRGSNGLECICLLLAYKIKYPENFFMIRGNHECAAINRIYGFYDECARAAPSLKPPHCSCSAEGEELAASVWLLCQP